MTARRVTEQHVAQQQFDQYVRETASSRGASAEIEKAKQLLDSGPITGEKFEQTKRKALP
jgi:hypothetical protein